MRYFLLIIVMVMGQSVLAADKKPLTKEESAKVIESAIRKEINKPAGELTKADLEEVAGGAYLDAVFCFVNVHTERIIRLDL